MRAFTLAPIILLAVSTAHATDDTRAYAFSLGGFAGDETNGFALGFYFMRPKSFGWYVNGTVSYLVYDDEDFRPIPGDIRVDSDSDSMTLNTGLTFALGSVMTYVGAGISQVSEYGLYRTPTTGFWYEEKDQSKANFNVGVLIALSQNLGLDLGVNSANEEFVLGLNWIFR
jgi:hypothetical protein